MTLTGDCVFIALQAKADDRGYVRTTIDQLVNDAHLSRSTVKRSLSHLEHVGLIRRRVKDGRDGGLLIRLETGSETGSKPVQKPVQNEPVDHVFDQTPSPEGALGGLIGARETGPTGSPSTSGRGLAYRPVRPQDTPPSGAEWLYEEPGGDGKWRRVSATLWEAPNGDTVSVRSMTPELRRRLRAGEHDDGDDRLEAVRAIRGTLEPDDEVDVR